jgi:DNA-binding beta-propeller fold protein YncE
VDIDAGLKDGRWTIARQIETPLLARIGHGNGPGVRGATVCAATNRCYVSCGDKGVCHLICVDLGDGKVVYEKEVPGVGRVQVTPDGSTVFLPVDWFGGKSACALDAADAKVKKLFPARYEHHLAMGSGGKFLYAPFKRQVAGKAPGMHVIDTRTFEIVREIIVPGGLMGSPPHIQVDAQEKYVYVYCRINDPKTKLPCPMYVIEPADGKVHDPGEPVKLGQLWPDAPQEARKADSPLMERYPSYHGIGFFPDGKKAWVGMEGNCPDLVEFDLTASPPKATRVIQGGPLRRAKGWAFISRKGDVVYTSNGRMFGTASGKLLGEVQYDDGSPLYSSKLCEVDMRGDKVVFGSSSVACGYPA